jgi:AbrB family looped-hinge helix DNA binding protein
MPKRPRFYGSVTVGKRGQVVIPKDARKLLDIKAGDKLVAVSGPPNENKMISFISVSDFEKFLSKFEKHISELKTEYSKKGKE